MKAFHNYIVSQIETNLTQFKKVDRFNSQVASTRDRTHEQILYPAVFIEYIPGGTRALSLGIIDQEFVVRMRVATENYSYSKKDSFDTLTLLSNFMERLRGNEADAVQFTSFEEVGRGIDDDGDSIVFDYIDYRVVYRNLEVYNNRNSGNIVVNPVSPDVQISE